MRYEICCEKEIEMLMPDFSTGNSVVPHKHDLLPLLLCWDLFTLLTVHEDQIEKAKTKVEPWQSTLFSTFAKFFPLFFITTITCFQSTLRTSTVWMGVCVCLHFDHCRVMSSGY